MALELRQQLKLTQQLVMTPQLQQAIKLLQLSRLELVDSIRQELLENPVLEESLEPVEDLRAGTDKTPEKAEDRFHSVDVEQARHPQDAEWQDYLGEFSSVSRQMHGRDLEIPEEGMSLEARLAGKTSLTGHLTWQLRLSELPAEQMTVADLILGNLDALGFLRAALMQLIADIVTERDLSVLFTEHDMDVVFAHAQRVMVLNRGRLIANGPVEQIRADPHVQEVYLGGGTLFKPLEPARDA